MLVAFISVVMLVVLFFVVKSCMIIARVLLSDGYYDKACYAYLRKLESDKSTNK